MPGIGYVGEVFYLNWATYVILYCLKYLFIVDNAKAKVVVYKV